MDLAGVAILDGSTATAQAFQFTPGLLKFDYFNNISGTAVSALTSDSRYPNNPTATYYMTAFDSRTVFPDDSHDNYGAHVLGLFVPPASGNWIFYLKSDDASQLYLNPSGVDPAGKVLLTEELACCTAFSAHASTPQALTAGREYYIEGLLKEGGGGDFIQVAAKLDTDLTAPDSLTPIPGLRLGMFANPVGTSLTVTQQPQNTLFIISPVTSDGSGGLGGSPLVTNDFNSNNGGFTVDTPQATEGPWLYNAAGGAWHEDGQNAEDSHPNTTKLNSPAYRATLAGNVRLTFQHRWSFEYDGTAWDGGQVRVSINGGPYTAVPLTAFSQGGYNGSVANNSSSDLKNQPAYISQSANYTTDYITSVADLGFLNAGDTVSVEFMAASDTNTRGAVPNWEITSFALNQGALTTLSTFTAAAVGSINGQGTTVYYQWEKNTGAGWVDIAGANGTTYTLAPLYTDTGTKFRVRVVIPGNVQLSSEATLTVQQLNTPPSFTKGADQYPCTVGGAVTVPGWATGIRPHSIPVQETTFSSDFASGPRTPGPVTYTADFSSTPAGAVTYGSAAIAGGFLHLTDNANSLAGSMLINGFASGSAVQSFTASFKLRIGDGTGNAADGFSFNLAGDLPDAATGATAAEEGIGTGLSICVDNYPTGGTDAPSVKIKWGGNLITGGLVMIQKWGSPNFIPVSINLDADGTLDVMVNGTNIVSNLPTPYTPVIGRFGLFARTGGENETHWVDDLNITATVLQGASAPAGSTLLGNAYIADGSLHLTDAANGQNGTFIVGDLLGGARLGSFTMTFNARIGGGTTPPADGFGVSVANTLAGLFGEEGDGNGLTVAFDNYDNGGGEAPAIDVKWAGTTIAHTLIPTIETLGQFVPVTIRLYANGALDVIAAGTPVYTNLATGYVPIIGARFGIGARTGGLNENAWIDDLHITAAAINAADVEASQTVQFAVTNDNPALFAVQPAVSPNGTLTYKPASNALAIAHVTVVARDNGGTAFGGRDTSASQTFQIIMPGVMTPVTVSIQPQGHAYTSCGGVHTFGVSVVGGGCPVQYSYYWLHNGVLVPGGTNATLTVNVVPASVGDYAVIVFSAAGQLAVSDRALLTLGPDVEPPVFTCPSPRTMNLDPSTCQAVLPNLLAGLVVTDACGAVASLTMTPPAGTAIGVGVTNVVIRAVDASNNTNTCVVPITVVDLVTNISLTIRRNGTNAVLSWPKTCKAWILQSATNLAPATNWLNSTATPVIVSNRWQVVEPAVRVKFYQLRAAP